MGKNYIGEIISGYEILEKTTKKDTSGHYLYKCRCIYCNTIEFRDIRTLNQQKGIKCSHFDRFGFPNFPYTYTLDKSITHIFNSMKNRCYNQKSKEYKWYGGKGIKICNEWLYNPTLFADWALKKGYKKGLTVDRIDEKKDYCPKNCRWISREENSRRAGKVNWITINGESLTGRQWSIKINKHINYVNLYIKKFGKEKTREMIKDCLFVNRGVV
jgi:hypothetical protein